MKFARAAFLIVVLAILGGCKDGTPAAKQTGGMGYDRPTHRPRPPKVTVAVVFREKQPVAYMDGFRRGALAAADDIKDMDVLFFEPKQPTAKEQIDILESQRLLGRQLIAVESADPLAICPKVKLIRRAEIPVLTFEADCDLDKSSRLFFLSPFPTVPTAKLLADLAVREIGGSGEIAIISGSVFSVQQKRMTQLIEEKLKKDYPNLKLAATQYAGDIAKSISEDATLAKAATAEILKNPNIKAVIVLSRHILPVVAEAIEEAKAADRVAVIGIGLPSAAREHMKRGTVRYLLTWNPEDWGYFNARIARLVADRKVASNQKHFIARLGFCVMDDDEMPMSEAIVLTTDTLDGYDW